MDTSKIWIKIEEDDNGEIHSVVVSYPVFKKEINNKFYVQTPVLRAIGYSDVSLEDARKQLNIDVEIFFKIHLKRKSLKTALAALGWKRQDKSYAFAGETNYISKDIEIGQQQLQCA